MQQRRWFTWRPRYCPSFPHGSFYNVEYKNLVTEGEDPQPLVETISADEIRPMPPKLSQPSMFSLHDKVDAFDLDAWWFGGITGQEGDTYSVYFPTTNDVCKYPLQLTLMKCR
ncbi:hypothetical protein F2Q69_00058278 [Brassica cretica]|uniref:Agenet-like domain-containing protein n=1 Tax=Brassica cretica TaxID=69181 RepID=A0A8S9RMN1_BRACR|nr:hypothetical protein F2Q69_00058278 [Brassica cretica]